MNSSNKIPFTDDGMIEATTYRVLRTTVNEAWRQIVTEAEGLSESDRARALSTDFFVKPPAAYDPGLHLAESCKAVAIQGGWWYRGVTCVQPHPDGTLVSYTVVNVAPGWTKWLAHFVQARAVRQNLSRTME